MCKYKKSKIKRSNFNRRTSRNRICATKIAELYSHHFPHQVIINEDGTIEMLNNRFYYAKIGKRDCIILVGDVQPISSEAQYEVMQKIINFFDEMGGKEIITLGGYATGRVMENPRVLGAVTHSNLVDKLKNYGVVFGANADGSIIGAAGLLLAIGKLAGMKGICLMGETHGNYIDYNSAKKVIEILEKILEVKIDTSKLEEKAREIKKTVEALEAQMKKAKESAKKEELTYFR
ncbi:MAG: proteasome assembly chaperone family protein [Candidatus Micrarchaeia archaeon]